MSETDLARARAIAAEGFIYGYPADVLAAIEVGIADGQAQLARAAATKHASTGLFGSRTQLAVAGRSPTSPSSSPERQ
jgi:hypothetical protein